MAIRFADRSGGVLRGTNSNDVLWGREGNDVIYGYDSADNIYGGWGRDDLYGGAGSDYLRGGSGSDTLRGGHGDDLLAGGANADFFVFVAAERSDIDTIRDFEVGVDQLVLGGILTVDPNRSFRADIDFDGETDTVLTLSNSATILLLGVGERLDWSMAGPNVMRLSDLDPLV